MVGCVTKYQNVDNLRHLHILVCIRMLQCIRDVYGTLAGDPKGEESSEKARR